MRVTIIETGLANIASVRAAFRRLGCETVLTQDPTEVAEATALVLPGVGRFGAGVARLQQLEMVKPLQTRVRAGQPTLGICLGLQLLTDASDETPGVAGLGCIPGTIEAFPQSVRRPQFGWNWLANENATVLGAGGYVYYANSYRLTQAPSGWNTGWTEYGGQFVGCLQRGAVVACQFHPELSGPYGQEILSNWLNLAGGAPC